MDWQNLVGGLLNQYMQGGGARNRQEARDHYDQISSAVPTDLLGSIIGPALSSLGTQQVQERIYNSATEMDTQQRAGFLEKLLGGYRSSGTDIFSLLGNLGINSSVANNPGQASPEEVAKLAAYTQQNDPGLFDRAMEFYAENPTLVKVLGTMAVTAIAKQLYDRTKGGDGRTMAAAANSESNQLEQLKGKYHTVLAVIQQQGVQLTNLHAENGKLVIRGRAPSVEAANRVWDQIKLHPDYARDLMVDIKTQ
jgi:hypothetical protein